MCKRRLHDWTPSLSVSRWAGPAPGGGHPLDPDEVQFQIAACAEIGGHLEAAISAYEKLRATDPRSKLVLFATAHLGILYALKGRLGRAATCLEEYAARYAGERNAKDALDSRFADSE
jgi:tetratricopeptide (TPR) repeat protein